MAGKRPANIRNHRVEVYSPSGRWVWGQWVNSHEGIGTYIDRLERAAMDTLGSSPAGSTARVFRYAERSIEPVAEVLSVTLATR